MSVITRELLDKALSYEDYRALMTELVAQSRTTGPRQSAALAEFTRLNHHRMNRLDKHTTVIPELQRALDDLPAPLVWVVLAEAWCGDVAQNLPVIAHIAAASDRVELFILLRDEHPDVMAAYQTNGSSSIPKLVCLDGDTMADRWTWGPRPEPAQAIIREFKANPEGTKEDVMKKLHLWYGRDRGDTLQGEFREFLSRLTEPDQE
jgi:hypothetical protein